MRNIFYDDPTIRNTNHNLVYKQNPFMKTKTFKIRLKDNNQCH